MVSERPARGIRTIIAWALLACAAGVLLVAGAYVRHWTWDRTEPIRFRSDMDNAWTWGSRAAIDGYFSLYDDVIAEQSDGRYELDYVPLRLAVMTLWARHRLAHHPFTGRWENTYEFNKPLLWFNTAMEVTAAVGVFALARMWMRRDGRVRTGEWRRIEWIALIAFALAWLNPASILSAHARPTWDVWVAPFYLWAVFCACRNWWFAAGCLVGVGAMLKGQQLVVAPIFVLWPLMGFRFGAAGRWVVGFALSITLITLPWLVPLRAGQIVFVLVILLLAPGIWIASLEFDALKRIRFPARSLRWTIPATFVLSVWLTAWLFGGSFGWYKVGFVYGAEKFRELEVGGASSLASILQNRFGWRAHHHALTIPGLGINLNMTELLAVIYALLLILCSLGMRLAERRGDRVFLLAMAAPWIVYFAVAPKMHERYLLWGAIAACTAVGVGLGPTLLAIFFSLCSANMSLFQLLNDKNASKFLADYSPSLGESLFRFTRGTFPDIAWAILLATGVWVYLCYASLRAIRTTLTPGGVHAG